MDLGRPMGDPSSAPRVTRTRSRSTTDGTSGASSTSLSVELVPAPLTPDLWATYEGASRSYGCTREFIEYFERPAAPALAVVRSRETGEVRAAFLFTQDGGTLHVLGRFSAPPADAVAAFAEAIFSRDARVRRIETGLIDAFPDLGVLGRPALALHEASEMRISLPATLADYERTLSKDFLSRCRHDERRLARELPSAQFATREGADIPAQWIAEVVRLNRERQASKNGRSVFGPEYEEGISRVARRHGCVTVLHDGSRVYAGVIDIRCGTDVFGWVIGHDNAFGKLRPGRLVQVAGIRYCVSHGYRTLHYLHGESSYKQEVGGRVVRLAEYVLLRSWSALRPSDVERAIEKQAVRLARRSVDRADGLARRVLGRPGAPVKSWLQSVARAARRLGPS